MIEMDVKNVLKVTELIILEFANMLMNIVGISVRKVAAQIVIDFTFWIPSTSVKSRILTVLHIVEADVYNARIHSMFIRACAILMLKDVLNKQILKNVKNVNQDTNLTKIFVHHK